MLFEWDFNKNKKIKQESGVSFEEIILAIDDGQLLIEFPNERYTNQKIIVVNINNYAWVVPTE